MDVFAQEASSLTKFSLDTFPCRYCDIIDELTINKESIVTEARFKIEPPNLLADIKKPADIIPLLHAPEYARAHGFSPETILREQLGSNEYHKIDIRNYNTRLLPTNYVLAYGKGKVNAIECANEYNDFLNLISAKHFPFRIIFKKCNREKLQKALEMLEKNNGNYLHIDDRIYFSYSAIPPELQELSRSLDMFCIIDKVRI